MRLHYIDHRPRTSAILHTVCSYLHLCNHYFANGIASAKFRTRSQEVVSNLSDFVSESELLLASVEIPFFNFSALVLFNTTRTLKNLSVGAS